jgi:hypothetical protein
MITFNMKLIQARLNACTKVMWGTSCGTLTIRAKSQRKQVEKDETTVHPSKTAVGATFLAAFLAHVDTEQSRTTDLRLELSTKWLKPDRIDVLSTVPLARTISNYFAPNKAVVQEADLSQPTAFADINKRFSSRDADIVQLDPTAHPPVKNIRKAHIEIQKGKRLTAVAREAEYRSFLADLTCGLDADIVQLDPTAHPPVKNIRKAHIEIQKGKRLAPEPIDFDDII